MQATMNAVQLENCQVKHVIYYSVNIKSAHVTENIFQEKDCNTFESLLDSRINMSGGRSGSTPAPDSSSGTEQRLERHPSCGRHSGAS